MKKFLKIILVFILFGSIVVSVNAHESLIICDDESCALHNDTAINGDDITWFNYSNRSLFSYPGLNAHIHFPDDQLTIKYYFSNFSDLESNYSWTSEVSSTVANEIKSYIENSILSWNDVYYYSYNSQGNRISNHLINVCEGSSADYNIIIFPASNSLPLLNNLDPYSTETSVACTVYDDDSCTVEEITSNDVHIHCTQWKMYFNISKFYINYSCNNVNEVESNRLRAGAHELGHVLGLGDFLDECNQEGDNTHAKQLMGYVKNYGYNYDTDFTVATVPTYKDFIGAAITRGIHTDDDHVWIKEGTSTVRCLLCNCIRRNVSIVNNVYEGQTLNTISSDCIYNFNNHFANKQMTLVGTNGVYDYFKCMTCKHVEEVKIIDSMTVNNSFNQNNYNADFDIMPIGTIFGYKINVTTQSEFQVYLNNYYTDTIVNFSSYLFDEYMNVIQPSSNSVNSTSAEYNYNLPVGTYYYLFRNDSMSDSIDIRFKKMPHYHNYSDHYLWLNNSNHRAYCYCGMSMTQPHIVGMVNGNPGNVCLLCGGHASGGFIINSIGNGIYILSGGCIAIDNIDWDLNNFYQENTYIEDLIASLNRYIAYAIDNKEEFLIVDKEEEK